MTSQILRAADGTRIAAESIGDGAITFVIAHGFTGHRGRTGVRLVAQWLAQHGRVVVFDQRGHGESSGYSTLGFREPLDLDAVCAWARELSDAPLVTVGFSLGASVALRQAALATAPELASRKDAEIVVHQRPDATVLISGAGEWFYRESTVMDRLHALSSTAWGRLALRLGQGVRLNLRDWTPGPAADADALPTSPVACAAMIRRPLLLVHGDQDQFFPPEHSERIYAAARQAGNARAVSWLEPGMGHAERGASEELLARVAAWAARAVQDA